jgi:hypothetical protein
MMKGRQRFRVDVGLAGARLQDPRPVARSIAQRPNLGLSAGQARTVVMHVHIYA